MAGTVNRTTTSHWDYDGSYTATVEQNEWAFTGSGSGTVTWSSDLDYAGFGFGAAYSRYDTGDTNGYDVSAGVFREGGQHHNDETITYDWTLTPDGYIDHSHSLRHEESSGNYFYLTFSSGYGESHTGDYDAGNGTVTITRDSDYTRVTESFAWEETVNEYEDVDTDGVVTTWGDSSGEASGSGDGFWRDYDAYTFKSATTTATSIENEVNSSGSSHENSDRYEFSGEWTEFHTANDAAVFDAEFVNRMTGSATNSTFTNWTRTLTTFYGSESGGETGSSSSTDTFTTSGTYTTFYDRTNDGMTFDQSGHVYPGAQSPWAVGVPCSGTGIYFQPGIPTTDSSGGGGEDPPAYVDPLEGGPWFEAGEIEGIGLIVESNALMLVGFFNPIGFDEVLENSQEVGLHYDHDDYATGNWLETEFNRMVGESVRSVVGDEALINATDFQLFVGVAGVSTVLVLGAYFFPYYVAGGIAAGAVVGGLYYGAGCLDGKWEFSGRGLAQAMFTGGVMGGLGATVICTLGAVLPQSIMCLGQQVAGITFAAAGLHSAAQNYEEGNYATGTLDAIFAGLAFLALPTASASWLGPWL